MCPEAVIFEHVPALFILSRCFCNEAWCIVVIDMAISALLLDKWSIMFGAYTGVVCMLVKMLPHMHVDHKQMNDTCMLHIYVFNT